MSSSRIPSPTSRRTASGRLGRSDCAFRQKSIAESKSGRKRVPTNVPAHLARGLRSKCLSVFMLTRYLTHKSHQVPQKHAKPRQSRPDHNVDDDCCFCLGTQPVCRAHSIENSIASIRQSDGRALVAQAPTRRAHLRSEPWISDSRSAQQCSPWPSLGRPWSHLIRFRLESDFVIEHSGA